MNSARQEMRGFVITRSGSFSTLIGRLLADCGWNEWGVKMRVHEVITGVG